MNSRLRGSSLPLAAAVACLVLIWLYTSAPAIGYARDEGFYFQAATEYGKWLKLLVSDPEQALTRRAIDSYFRINAEHPSLMKLLFASSHCILYEWLHIIPTPGLSFRLPAMVLSALATGLVVQWGSQAISRWAGVVAGLLFITLPRVFHHAHLACFDVPVAATILFTVYCYSRALATRKLSWTLAVGLCYGLALDTKHNAWTLPPLFAFHWLLFHGFDFWVCPARKRVQLVLPLISVVTIGPLVLLLLWPWLWFDTLERVGFWVQFHLRHDYYNMEFLGRTYHRPPMPRAYPWVMTLATVPLTTLLLFCTGLCAVMKQALHQVRSKGWRCSVVSSSHRLEIDLLWLMAVLAAYLPWCFSSTPIFGGTKHWLAAYPFLCLIAGRGFELLAVELRPRFPHWSALARRQGPPVPQVLDSAKMTLRAARWRIPTASRFVNGCLCCVVTAVCVSAPFVITFDSTPYGLSSYTPLVGGAQGAASIGLNRTFWGYTSLKLADEMSRRLPHGGPVFVHDTALQSWYMHQRDGAIAANLQPTLNLAQSKLGLYHHEPHMERVEYQLWEAYGTTVPVAIATFGGVPIVWLYERPEP